MRTFSSGEQDPKALSSPTERVPRVEAVGVVGLRCREVPGVFFFFFGGGVLYNGVFVVIYGDLFVFACCLHDFDQSSS